MFDPCIAIDGDEGLRLRVHPSLHDNPAQSCVFIGLHSSREAPRTPLQAA